MMNKGHRTRLMLAGAAMIWLASTAHGVHAAAFARGQAAKTTSGNVWSKVYTQAQAARGEKAFFESCVACHGEDLTGSGNAPSLVGEDFLFSWTDRNVGELFERIRTLMPTDAPNSLTPETYRDIVTFILKSNKFPAGEADLPVELPALEQIKITKAQP